MLLQYLSISCQSQTKRVKKHPSMGTETGKKGKGSLCYLLKLTNIFLLWVVGGEDERVWGTDTAPWEKGKNIRVEGTGLP